MPRYSFKSVSRDEYNPFTSVSIVFYCYDQQGSPEFLLTRNADKQTYREITDAILDSDSTSILAAARVMVQKLRGCFSKSNLEKLVEGATITEEDLLPENLAFFEMWEHPLFFEWIRKFLENSYTIEFVYGKLILFVELPKFDAQNLNAGFNDACDFKWVTGENLKNLKEVDSEVRIFANEFDIPAFIATESAALPEGEEALKQETFIVLSCKPVDKATAVDPMYLHFPALFQGLFRRSGEQWIHYNAAVDEFPSEELMRNVKAIIIPGSSASAYDPQEGIEKLKQWIREFDKKYPTIKMLGVCFGAQVICEALGGKVDKMEPRKEDPEYYLVASEVLKASDAFYELPFVNKALPDRSGRLCIVEAHGDEVKELPAGFRNLASSTTCKNELFVSESGRYLGIQGHPEYSPEFITAKKILILAQSDPEAYPLEKFDELKNEVLKSDFRESATCNMLRSICYAFLKHVELDL